jgi:hypothetical protein
VLDLKTEEGREAQLALVDTADVLIEKFAPGTMERLQVAPAQLLDRNPRLIVASGKGYGSSGPYAHMAAMDITVQAMSASATHETPPAPCAHRAEHVQAVLRSPVDDEGLARCPYRRPATTVMVGPSVGLGLGHQPAEVAGRARVAIGSGLGQEPLGRDASLRALDPSGHELADDVCVLGLPSLHGGIASAPLSRRKTSRLTV